MNNIFQWISIVLMLIVAVLEARELAQTSDKAVFRRSALLCLLSVVSAGLLIFG